MDTMDRGDGPFELREYRRFVFDKWYVSRDSEHALEIEYRGETARDSGALVLQKREALILRDVLLTLYPLMPKTAPTRMSEWEFVPCEKED